MLLRLAFLFNFGALSFATKQQCKLNSKLILEIRGYQPLVDKIIKAVKGPYKNKLYSDLADFVDNNGARLSGSTALEDAIDDVIERQKAAKLEVSTHDVMVPNWTRGQESAEVISPRRQKLTMLGLGGSSNTSAEGITAKVVVIKDFDELEARKAEVPGNIVLFNAKFVNYKKTTIYRVDGPNRASMLGAVAVLVRSITPFSIGSPHTGQTVFKNDSLRIPAAAITLENANFIARLVVKGINVVVNIKMSAINGSPVKSRNVIADIVGSKHPQNYVTISGHIDSWDVGQGAMDDAGGAFLAWHSLALIRNLGLHPPKRTLRSILWTAEEPGLVGAHAYRQERSDEVRNWTIAFESDEGVFRAKGIGFSGSDIAACIMKQIASLFSVINATQVNRQPTAGSDIGVFTDLGVPLAEAYMVPNRYFWFHHTNGDWMDVYNSEDLDQNLALFAATSYILADLSVSLPKMPVTASN